MRFSGPERIMTNLPLLDRVAYAFFLYKAFPKRYTSERDRQLYARIYVLANRDLPVSMGDWERISKEKVVEFRPEWEAFVEYSSVTKKNFWRNVIDPKSGKTITAFSAARWERSSEFVTDIEGYFKIHAYAAPKTPFVESSYYESNAFVEKQERERQKLIEGHLITLKNYETDPIGGGEVAETK